MMEKGFTENIYNAEKNCRSFGSFFASSSIIVNLGHFVGIKVIRSVKFTFPYTHTINPLFRFSGNSCMHIDTIRITVHLEALQPVPAAITAWR